MELYIDGWRRDKDWQSKLMGKYVNATHVTARLQIAKLSVSLHTDFSTVKWIPTHWMTTQLYAGQYTKVAEKKVGTTGRTDIMPVDHLNKSSWVQILLWFYGGQFIAPKWRPYSCVKNVRKVAQFYGYELPDTAYTDRLFA